MKPLYFTRKYNFVLTQIPISKFLFSPQISISSSSSLQLKFSSHNSQKNVSPIKRTIYYLMILHLTPYIPILFYINISCSNGSLSLTYKYALIHASHLKKETGLPWLHSSLFTTVSQQNSSHLNTCLYSPTSHLVLNFLFFFNIQKVVSQIFITLCISTQTLNLFAIIH